MIQADLRRHERIRECQLRGWQKRERQSGEGNQFDASACERLEKRDQAHDPDNAASVLEEGHFGLAHQRGQDLVRKGIQIGGTAIEDAQFL